MPKKTKAQKKHTNFDSRELILPEDEQTFAVVLKMSGGRRFIAKCVDGKSRSCLIRGTMTRGNINRVNDGDLVLISYRDYQDDKADCLLRYTPEEVRRMKKDGIIPESLLGEKINTEDEEKKDDDVPFDFDSI